jgi:hypothetical protein
MSLESFIKSKKCQDATEKASAADSLWFTRHPDRSFHLRPAYPNEFPRSKKPGAWCVIVTQIARGVRTRRDVYLTGLPAPVEEMDRSEDFCQYIAEVAWGEPSEIHAQSPSDARH